MLSALQSMLKATHLLLGDPNIDPPLDVSASYISPLHDRFTRGIHIGLVRVGNMLMGFVSYFAFKYS